MSAMAKSVTRLFKKKASQPKASRSEPEKTAGEDGIKKQYLKSGKQCKVTFRLPSVAASGADAVFLVGEFNGWDEHSTPMKKLRDGTFTVTLNLGAGHEYKFKYLVDGTRWENDWHADRYERNAFMGDDSVVVV